MIDLHCHILPELDDGPTTLAQSVAMARVAAADGVTTIVATPHVNGPFPSPAQILTKCKQLNETLLREGIPLEILPGAEMYAMADRAFFIDRTINSTPYILVEFPLTHLPAQAARAIFNLQVNGFKPVIAHPERIPNVVAKPQLMEELLAGQVYLQLTAGSLTGSFGPGPEKCARYLLKKGVVHFIASDGHAVDYRRPVLSEGLKIASRLIGNEAARRLVLDNPKAVLAGEELDG